MVDLRTKFQASKEAYEPLRTSLLEDDSKWVAAAKEVKEKKTVLDDLKHQYSVALSAASKAKAAARKVAAAAGPESRAIQTPELGRNWAWRRQHELVYC